MFAKWKAKKAKKAGKIVAKETVKEELQQLLTGFNQSIKAHFTHKKMTPIHVLASRGKRK